MRLLLLCVTKRPAAWVSEAAGEYLKRLQGKLDLSCRDLPPAVGTANAEQQRFRESETILKAIPPQALVIALDERGEQWSTAELARALDDWRTSYKDVALIIGGAEGLAPVVRTAANRVWSLTRLTLPQQLVRVIVLEQIYRAWSLLNNHPYHRA